MNFWTIAHNNYGSAIYFSFARSSKYGKQVDITSVHVLSDHNQFCEFAVKKRQRHEEMTFFPPIRNQRWATITFLLIEIKCIFDSKHKHAVCVFAPKKVSNQINFIVYSCKYKKSDDD